MKSRTATKTAAAFALTIGLGVAAGSIAAVAATAASATPEEILADAEVPGEFELASDELREQDFDAFSRLSPYSVGHVQPGSNEADAMLAGVDIWGFGDDENLLREVVRWSSADVARSYLLEVANYATGDALGEIEPPFDGARAFSGQDPIQGVWARMIVWTEGSYGAAITHFSSGGDPSDEVINATAAALAAELERAVRAADVTEGDETISSNGSGDGAGDGGGDGGGGIPITTVLAFVAIVGGAIWLFLRFRRRRAGASAPGRSSEPETSSDDIIERARERARDEVDAASDTWQIPDDY